MTDAVKILSITLDDNGPEENHSAKAGESAFTHGIWLVIRVSWAFLREASGDGEKRACSRPSPGLLRRVLAELSPRMIDAALPPAWKNAKFDDFFEHALLEHPPRSRWGYLSLWGVADSDEVVEADDDDDDDDDDDEVARGA